MDVTDRTHSDGGRRTAELWLRADVPHGADDRQARLHERAVATDAFADVRTRLVPNRLGLEGVAVETPAGRDLRDAVEDVRRWATDAGVDVDAYFPVSEESSMIEDCDRRVVTFPSVAFLEYDADGLARVTPHVAGGRVVSVEARLDALVNDVEGELVVIES